MTADLHDVQTEATAADAADLFRDVHVENATVMADAVIAQVIQLKDPDERISSAVWWRVAELLRACTTATSAGSHLTAMLIEHTFAEADDALNALTADTYSESGGREVDTWLPFGRGYDALAATKTACLRLGRLLFSLDPTTPAILATRVNQLQRSLAVWHCEALESSVRSPVRAAD